MGEAANQLFGLADAVITRGNPNAVTDGIIAAINARAAVRSAFLNVKINLGSIVDEAFVTDLRQNMTVIEANAEIREHELLKKTKI